uniref:M56 family metallopeptidase n=1 Tax=Anaerosporobacter sp. TaxID=1872529 RepID=UPI00286F25F8
RRVFDVESKLPVYVADVIQTPCMFGVFRPAIYITEEVANDKNTLRYVLAHEEMHYRHGDNWWTVLRSICLIVHWYNPLVWLAAILSKADAELACDEATLKHLGSQERFAYGQVLIELSTKKSSSREFLRCATTMKSNKKQMKERIQFISRKPRMLIQAFVIVVGLIAIAVIVTFTGQKASDDSAAEEFTKMETWNSASLKGVVAHSKGDNAEISQEQSALEDIAQDDSQENGTEDGVSGNIDIQEDGYSMNKQIVGTSITPSAELVSALEGEVEDWRRDFFTFANRALMAMNEEEDNENKNEEFRNAYYLVGETSSFITYGKGDLNSFVIKTNEGDYIAVDSPYTSNYCVSPVFGEKDYDGDGDEELAIITYFLHGTGVSIYTLYMVDKQADGQWNVYQYCAENYLSQLGEHYETVIDAQGIQLKVDSALVGRKIAIENKTYLYTAGDQIGFELRDNTIKMNALITASNTKLNEPRYIYSEDGLKADVLYMGDGKWGLSKVAYYNDGIESMMASIVEFYFYNNSDMLNIYAAKDTSLETYGETVRELPKTINISYDSKLMNEDKLIVSACLLSTPTSDSYDYLTCELVYEDSEDSPVGVWRIRSIGLEK